MKNSMSFFASMLLAVVLLAGGCSLDPLTERGSYSPPKPTVDAGGHHGGYDAGGSGGVDTYTCTPQCGGKVCGSNGCGGTCGTCGSSETCSAGMCVAMGSSCSNCSGFAPKCYPSGGGLAIKCHSFLNECDAQNKCVVGPAFNDTCDDGNSTTADSVKSISDSDWFPKAELCIHTPIGGGGGQTGCTVTGCPAGQGCNSATGVCQVAGGTQGNLNCAVQRMDSTSWDSLRGGGVAGMALVDLNPWYDLGKPNSAGIVNVTLLAGQGVLSFLPIITPDVQWAYGEKGSKDQIIGDWKVTCDGNPPYIFKEGSTPVCSSAVPVNIGCTSKSGPGKYTLGFRAR